MFKRIPVFLIVLILISACSVPDSAPLPSTATPFFTIAESESTPSPIANNTPEGDDSECDNPFYPVSDGATWMYSHSDGSNSISTMSADDFGKFVITAEGSGSKFTIDGECTPDGIVIMNAPGALTP